MKLDLLTLRARIQALHAMKGTGFAPELADAQAAAAEGRLFFVDTKNDGEDSLVVAASAPAALETVALAYDPEGCDRHVEGALGLARDRGWTADGWTLVATDDEDEDGRHEPETPEHFAARVLDRTGVALASIPDGADGDLLGGHIFCRRGATYVVGVGYPEEDPVSGVEVYREFRVIRRTPDLLALAVGDVLRASAAQRRAWATGPASELGVGLTPTPEAVAARRATYTAAAEVLDAFARYADAALAEYPDDTASLRRLPHAVGVVCSATAAKLADLVCPATVARLADLVPPADDLLAPAERAVVATARRDALNREALGGIVEALRPLLGALSTDRGIRRGVERGGENITEPGFELCSYAVKVGGGNIQADLAGYVLGLAPDGTLLGGEASGWWGDRDGEDWRASLVPVTLDEAAARVYADTVAEHVARILRERAECAEARSACLTALLSGLRAARAD